MWLSGVSSTSPLKIKVLRKNRYINLCILRDLDQLPRSLSSSRSFNSTLLVIVKSYTNAFYTKQFPPTPSNMDSHVTPKAMGALNPGNNQKGFSAPPSQPGQQQPWKNWFSPQSLDTEEHMKEDEKPQTCQGWTQAVTNIG